MPLCLQPVWCPQRVQCLPSASSLSSDCPWTISTLPKGWPWAVPKQWPSLWPLQTGQTQTRPGLRSQVRSRLLAPVVSSFVLLGPLKPTSCLESVSLWSFVSLSPPTPGPCSAGVPGSMASAVCGIRDFRCAGRAPQSPGRHPSPLGIELRGWGCRAELQARPPPQTHLPPLGGRLPATGRAVMPSAAGRCLLSPQNNVYSDDKSNPCSLKTLGKRLIYL